MPRRFEFVYRVPVPAHHQRTRVWIPLPGTDPWQDIREMELTGPLPAGTTEASRHGILHVEVPASEQETVIGARLVVERRPRTAGDSPRPEPVDTAELQRSLQPDRRVPTDGQFGDEARRAIPDGLSPREKAKAAFQWVLDTYGYDASGCTPDKGEALGDLQVACDLKLGTCTELHGLLVSFLRAAGVPARFAFGFNVPARPQGRIAGYHCWAEVHLPESGWFPIDVSEAWKRPAGPEREFYFGNLDENRVQFSMGRDRLLTPPQATGPVDKFIFPLAEREGQKIELLPEFSFRSLEG